MIKEMTKENISKLCSKTEDEMLDRITIISGIIWFFLTHGYIMYNKIAFHDDAIAQFGIGVNYEGGRWLYAMINSALIHIFGIDSNYSIPTFNMFILMICLLISSLLIIDLFKVKIPLICILITGLLITSPAIIGQTIFMFGIHYDGISILFAVLGAYLICKNRCAFGFFGGAVLICFSLAIYQAYIVVSACIMLIFFMIRVLEEGFKSWLSFIKESFLYLGAGIASLTIYGIFTFLICNIWKGVVVNYKGMDSVGKTGLLVWIDRIATIYKEFIRPDYALEYYPDTMIYIYYCMLIIIISGLIILARKKSILSKLQLVILLVFFPFIVNMAFIFCDPDKTNVMMYYGLCFIPIFLLILIESSGIDKHKIFTMISVFILMFTVIFYLRYANLCYYKAFFVQEEIKAYFNTLTTRIQSTQGYDDSYKIAYINDRQKEDNHRSMPDKLEPVGISVFAFDLDKNINSLWRAQMKLWTGFEPEEVEDISVYENTKQVREMPRYPDDGSIKIIDNVIVVKF